MAFYWVIHKERLITGFWGNIFVNDNTILIIFPIYQHFFSVSYPLLLRNMSHYINELYVRSLFLLCLPLFRQVPDIPKYYSNSHNKVCVCVSQKKIVFLCLPPPVCFLHVSPYLLHFRGHSFHLM